MKSQDKEINLQDVFIIVHGSSCFPYTKECIDSFSRYSNVIWSSWEDTPQDVLDHLVKKSITHTINKYPTELGVSKLNWQRTGFLNGLKVAKELGARYVYKVRTDLDIPNLDSILDILKNKIEHGGKKINILCFDELCNGFCDWCMFGAIEEMELFWNFPDINVFSERSVAPQYFALKGIPYDYTYRSALQLVDTHIKLYLDLGIPINWLKHTREDEHPITDHFSNSAIYH